MRQIIHHGRAVRSWLGVTAQDVTPELADSFGLHDATGILVSGVRKDGPADRAGIRPGDVITRIDDATPRNSHDLMVMIARQAPGSRLLISGWRGDDVLELEVTTAERPPLRRRKE
jgi:S1-C subfamily serine protease